MNKKLTITICLIVIISAAGLTYGLRHLREEHTQIYPQFVHNPCTGQWAIKTGETIERRANRVEIDYRDIIVKMDTVPTFVGISLDKPGFVSIRFNGITSAFIDPSRFNDTDNLGYLHDTIRDARVGGEANFPDSLSAINCWKSIIQTEREHKTKDSLTRARRERERFVKDSIFKCNHTYK